MPPRYREAKYDQAELAESGCRYLVTVGDKVPWIADSRIDMATDTDTLARVQCWWVGWHMSAFDVVESFRRNALPFRRQVTIGRDGEDFVVAFHPQNIVALRHTEACDLRRMCHSLRWEIVHDTIPEPADIRSW